MRTFSVQYNHCCTNMLSTPLSRRPTISPWSLFSSNDLLCIVDHKMALEATKGPCKYKKYIKIQKYFGYDTPLYPKKNNSGKSQK